LTNLLTFDIVNNDNPEIIMQQDSKLDWTAVNAELAKQLPKNDSTPEASQTNKDSFWRYEEGKTLKALEEYIISTYQSHYTSTESKVQVVDLFESIGEASAYSRTSAVKYLLRFGRKNGNNKRDLLKALHCCILLYHFGGLHNDATDKYETFGK